MSCLFSLERVWNKGLELSFFSLFFLFSVILGNGSGAGDLGGSFARDVTAFT